VLSALALWIVVPGHPSLRIGNFTRDLNVKLGLDLQGGTHLVYRADVTSIGEAEVSDALAGVRDVIERRVNAFGVSEPIVQTNQVGKEQRIIVELAGVHDPRAAIQQIGETPQLDFRREVAGEEAEAQFNVDDTALATPIFERTELTGKHLKRALLAFDQVSGAPQIDLEFDGEGTELFAELTRQSLNKRIAIYLDGVPISAPVVQSEITNGKAIISGGFALEEARQLAQRLTAGALPIPIELIGQQTIGPSLGKASINQSLIAGILGFIAVTIWMIAFYRLPGVIASIALLIYSLYFLAIVKLLPITLTLPGIAGFIMSIGMAVDSNVLIFERFRENLRAGKTMRYSLEDGFKEAWASIWASSIASLLTALILYSFGTSLIRGFALTLSLGIVLSLFTAIFVTRVILNAVLSDRRTHKASLLAVKKITA
ncbi:MAG: protein translocase subunit SecD, partial [Candidatus Andersenbacteria bacterium]